MTDSTLTGLLAQSWGDANLEDSKYRVEGIHEGKGKKPSVRQGKTHTQQVEMTGW